MSSTKTMNIRQQQQRNIYTYAFCHFCIQKLSAHERDSMYCRRRAKCSVYTVTHSYVQTFICGRHTFESVFFAYFARFLSCVGGAKVHNQQNNERNKQQQKIINVVIVLSLSHQQQTIWRCQQNTPYLPDDISTHEERTRQTRPVLRSRRACMWWEDVVYTTEIDVSMCDNALTRTFLPHNMKNKWNQQRKRKTMAIVFLVPFRNNYYLFCSATANTKITSYCSSQ